VASCQITLTTCSYNMHFKYFSTNTKVVVLFKVMSTYKFVYLFIHCVYAFYASLLLMCTLPYAAKLALIMYQLLNVLFIFIGVRPPFSGNICAAVCC